MAKWPKGFSYLEDQLKRAVSSVALNIAEGNSRTGTKDRKRFFNISKASATESASALDVAHALNMMKSDDYAELKDMLFQIVKMLSNLS